MSEQFDPEVLRALKKWPDVPACYEWLSLDRRGRWRLQGELINHLGAQQFLSRNYSHDSAGTWFVQNGPQRVYCDLDYTPWVYHIDGSGGLRTHTELSVQGLKEVLIDENGDVVLVTERGPGLLLDRDLLRFTDNLRIDGTTDGTLDRLCEMTLTDPPIRIEFRAATLSVRSALASEIPVMFQFTQNPQPSS